MEDRGWVKAKELKEVAEYLEQKAKEKEIEEKFNSGNEKWLHPYLDGEPKL